MRLTVSQVKAAAAAILISAQKGCTCSPMIEIPESGIIICPSCDVDHIHLDEGAVGIWHDDDCVLLRSLTAGDN